MKSVDDFVSKKKTEHFFRVLNVDLTGHEYSEVNVLEQESILI